MSRTIRIAVLGAVVATCGVLALPASAANTALEARMNGDKEVPGPGDPNGNGVADVRVNPARNRVCFDIVFRRIQDPFVGHIHKGRSGVAGPPRVDLFEDAQGADSPIEGCVRNQPTRLLRKIKNHPRRWYVNLHNTEFPDGAIRGQLRFAP
jgi:CHRD domain